MRSPEYEKVCQAVQAGEEKHVKHIVTHKIGKVTACHGGEFDVEVAGEEKTWIKENCLEEE